MVGLYFRLSLMREAQQLNSESKSFVGIALDAHVLELYSNAVATFVAKCGKPYFIDPILYRLTSDFFPECRDKRWADSLLERYGLKEFVSENEDGLTIDSLSQAGQERNEAGSSVDSTSLVREILEYQRGRVPGLGQGAAIWEVLEEDDAGTLLSAADFKPPEFLVAPSYFIDGIPALEACRTLAGIAMGLKKPGERIFAEMAVGRDNLTADVTRTRLKEAFGKVPLDGLLLWIADFREWNEDSAYLEAFANFIAELKRDRPKRAVYNLFGSYFSTVLAARGLLDASIQGVGISEFRDPFATGGGGVKRYYIPISHQSVGTDVADDLQQVQREIMTCRCGECSPSLPPSKMSTAALARHYVICRTREFEEAKDDAVGAIVKKLLEGKSQLDAVQSANSGLFRAHGRRLETWAMTLKKLSQGGVIS